jgi:hypothetical protein
MNTRSLICRALANWYRAERWYPPHETLAEASTRLPYRRASPIVSTNDDKRSATSWHSLMPSPQIKQTRAPSVVYSRCRQRTTQRAWSTCTTALPNNPGRPISSEFLQALTGYVKTDIRSQFIINLYGDWLEHYADGRS